MSYLEHITAFILPFFITNRNSILSHWQFSKIKNKRKAFPSHFFPQSFLKTDHKTPCADEKSAQVMVAVVLVVLPWEELQSGAVFRIQFLHPQSSILGRLIPTRYLVDWSVFKRLWMQKLYSQHSTMNVQWKEYWLPLLNTSRYHDKRCRSISILAVWPWQPT